jgi:hypothetical protein
VKMRPSGASNRYPQGPNRPLLFLTCGSQISATKPTPRGSPSRSAISTKIIKRRKKKETGQSIVTINWGLSLGSATRYRLAIAVMAKMVVQRAVGNGAVMNKRPS